MTTRIPDIRFKCTFPNCGYKTLYESGARDHSKNNAGHFVTDAPLNGEFND